jgi:hypothetical protein
MTQVKGTKMKHIDITPTWETAVNIYLLVLEEGSEQGKAQAREEIVRLARQYDALTADMKEMAA